MNNDNMPEKENTEIGSTEVIEKQAGEPVKAEAPAPVEQAQAENYAPVVDPVVVDATEEDENIPTLYSDKVIYTFSVFFSVIAGGILLARNLKEVDRKDGIPHVIAFSVIYTFLSAYFLNVIKLGLVGTATLAIIGSMVLNSFFWNTYIGKGITYYRKSYRKALIITLIILIPLSLLAVWGAAFSGQQPAEGMRIN
jgi:hypothetical protein